MRLTRMSTRATASTLAALCFVAAGSVTMTAATFSADSESRPTRLKVGRLDVEFHGSGALSVAALRPGVVQRRVVTATNGGTTTGQLAFELVGADPSSAVAQALQLEVERCSDPAATVCETVSPPRSVASLGRVPLGDIDAGTTRRFALVLRLPASADPSAVQGADLMLDVRWSAEA